MPTDCYLVNKNKNLTHQSGVTQGMPAFDDETFGPVAAITRVPDLDAAVEAANASQFGLHAFVNPQTVWIESL